MKTNPGMADFCSRQESNLPMQILDRAKGSGPWDFDYLNVKTGEEWRG